MYVTFSILITARKISLIYLLLYRTFTTSIAFMKRISSYVHSSVFMVLIIDTERFPLWKSGNVAFPFDFSAWIQIWMNIRKWSDLQIDRDNGKEMWINLMNLSLSPTDVTLSNTGREKYIYIFVDLSDMFHRCLNYGLCPREHFQRPFSYTFAQGLSMNTERRDKYIPKMINTSNILFSRHVFQKIFLDMYIYGVFSLSWHRFSARQILKP